MAEQPVQHDPRTLGRAAAALLLATALLLAADMLLLNLHSGGYTIEIGTYRAGFFLGGAFEPESMGTSQAYRWTSQHTTLRLKQVRTAPHAMLVFGLGGRPAPATVQITFNGQPWLAFEAAEQPRTYMFALPPTASRDAEIGITSQTFTAGGDDPRPLGVKLQRVRLLAPGLDLRTPPPASVLLQITILAAALLTMGRLGWGWRARGLALALLALALAGLLGGGLLVAYPYLARLAGAALALLALTWAGLPLAVRALAWAGGAREIALLWALMLGACVVRLLGALYPTFGGQDQFLHLKLLNDITQGQLIHTVVASEFGGGLALYPPATYLTLALGQVVTSDQVALLQGGLALLDGFTALLVALLARRLGGGRQAARMALLLYAGSATAFTAMSYGFSAQLFGQWFAAPIGLVLMSSDPPLPRRAWLAAALLLLMAVSSHIGAALLTVAWFGITLALMLTRPHRNLLWAIGVLAACALFALTTLYVDGIGVMLGHVGQAREGGERGWLPGATPLLWVGLRLAYSGVGLALLPCGLALIARARRGSQAGLVALAWLLAVLLFLVIDLLLALQVRYLYFFLPLALAAIAIGLGALARRGRWAYAAAWLTVLFVSAQGVALWFSVAFGDGKLSLTPLTH